MGLTPGAYLGPYQILSALGAGGMGEIIVVQHWTEELKRLVPIK